MYGSSSNYVPKEITSKSLETLPIIQKHATFRSYGAVALFYNYLTPTPYHAENCNKVKFIEMFIKIMGRCYWHSYINMHTSALVQNIGVTAIVCRMQR